MVLAVHGTRDPAGHRVLAEIAAAVRERAGGIPVRLAFADVRRPDVTDVLAGLSGPAVVVPAFLAAGYHVRTDLPARIAATGRADVVLAPPLGPDPVVVAAAHDRLLAAGPRPGTEVVLAAAGSSRPDARADVRRAARLLADRIGGRVGIGYLSGATGPTVAEVVARSRGPVAVAAWLLAPGAFHTALGGCGAGIVSDPLGAHPLIIERLLHSYHAAARLPVG